MSLRMPPPSLPITNPSGADLVEVGDGSLVLLQVALGPEGDGARVAPEWTLEVVDVDVQPQLRRFGKHLQFVNRPLII